MIRSCDTTITLCSRARPVGASFARQTRRNPIGTIRWAVRVCRAQRTLRCHVVAVLAGIARIGADAVLPDLVRRLPRFALLAHTLASLVIKTLWGRTQIARRTTGIGNCSIAAGFARCFYRPPNRLARLAGTTFCAT